MVAVEQRRRFRRVIGRHHRAEPAPHVEHLPHLCGRNRAPFGDQLEHGRHREGRRELVADAGADPQQVQHAAPRDVREPVHRYVASQQLEDRADVDCGGCEQLLAEAAPAKRLRSGVDRHATFVEQYPARERQPVGMKA